MSSDARKLPPTHDWRTTDQDEIERRRQRAREEAPRIENRSAEHLVFSNFRVHSPSGFSYEVEVRDIAQRHFSCTCVDFRINGLGTCKHVEAVLQHLEAKHPVAFATGTAQGSPRIELVPDPGAQTLRVESGLDRLPPRLRTAFDPQGHLRDPAAAARLVADLALNPIPGLRLSQDIAPWLDSRRRASERLRLRRDYEQKVQGGLHPLSETTVPLFPYQREGMLHLAFTERALLADEMGLGKTIQAIAACALLHRLGQARRVLVVAPASVKTEWEEQIGRFTSLPCQIVIGARATRLALYERPSFFTVVNYEQARADVTELNSRLRPDIVVLDEAQRIKTWNSLTAQSIKRLRSRYAFVLTGTPIENRIEELYSIVDFLDPTVLGPLFRFNRDYFTFDERGRPNGYRNLDKLRAAVRPSMLRRRKADVENELPSRNDRQLYVTLSESQRRHYAHHEQQAAGLLALAQRRALLPREQERLFRELAMMRMVCDTPYILTGDPEDRDDCPKLRELDAVLASALAEDGVKVIVFSEWIRMLELVRALLDRRRIGHGWHTGGLSQSQRRTEILKFKNDPACRIFLCSESGGVGLNLQNASIVINCDLPWNPAKYEQRVARAWRKHQTRPVTVINLIAEGTIEHRMLATLAVKQGLADGVLDGRGDLSQLQLRRGGAALLERVRQVLTPPPSRPAAPADRAAAFAERARGALESRLISCEERHAPSGPPTLWVVVAGDADAARARLAGSLAEAYRESGDPTPRLEVIDQASAELLRRLEAEGLVQRTARASRVLHPPPAPAPTLDAAALARIAACVDLVGRQLRLTRLLTADPSDFAAEAAAALRGAIAAASQALALRNGQAPPQEPDGPVPAWIAPHWGDARAVVEAFLAQPQRPLPPVIEAVERLRASLAPATSG